MPAATPVVMPVGPTAALVTSLLRHVPEGVASVRLVVKPMHTPDVPVIADGNGLMVIALVAIQPVGRVYVIFTVPTAIPVTMPVLLIVALVTSLLLHIPSGVASVKLVVDPAQTPGMPVITDGNLLTVTILPAAHPVGNI